MKNTGNKLNMMYDLYLQYLQHLFVFVIFVVGLSPGGSRCHGLMWWWNLDGYSERIVVNNIVLGL